MFRFAQFLFAILVFLTTANLVAASETITFAIDDWPPYVYAEDPFKGAASEIVVAACREVGLTPIFDVYPWKRCEYLVRFGNVFGTFPYLPTSERSDKFLLSDVILPCRVALYHLKENPLVLHDFSQLKGKRVAVQISNWTVPKLEKAGAVVFKTTSAELNVKMLLAGRVDYFFGNEIVEMEIIRKKFRADVHKIGCSRIERPEGGYVVMVTKDDPDTKRLLKLFNAGLKKVRESGEQERIMLKYGL